MTNKNILKQFGRILLPILIFAGAAILAVWFIKTKPAPKKQKPKPMASAVKTVTASSGTHKVIVSAMGTVVPVEEISLQPEVTGLVIWKNPNLVPGGIVKEGEPLLRIDPRNYETARKQQLATFEKAKVEYQIELSRSEVAAEEWRMMGMGSGELRANSKELGVAEAIDADAITRAKSLALREPQLRASKIAVLAASNLLQKATVDVERTQITAPFNAVVISESVDRGQLASPQSRLAQLAGTDAFRIEATLPVRDLQWIKRPDNNGQNGPNVSVLYDTGTSNPTQFNGRLTRILSSLDSAAKMAKILVQVDDPLMLKPQQPNTQPSRTALLSGAYVKVLIEGIPQKNVIKIPGTLIREGNKVWIMNAESNLEIRNIDLLWRQDGRALIKSGITDGEKIISSHISTPIPGMKLKKKGDNRKSKMLKTEKPARNASHSDAGGLKSKKLKVGQASPKTSPQNKSAHPSIRGAALPSVVHSPNSTKNQKTEDQGQTK